MGQRDRNTENNERKRERNFSYILKYSSTFGENTGIMSLENKHTKTEAYAWRESHF